MFVEESRTIRLNGQEGVCPKLTAENATRTHVWNNSQKSSFEFRGFTSLAVSVKVMDNCCNNTRSNHLNGRSIPLVHIDSIPMLKV
jgi:hypothetical protein